MLYYPVSAIIISVTHSLLQRYRRHAKLSENSPVVSDAEGSSSAEQDGPVLTARKQSMLDVHCSHM